VWFILFCVSERPSVLITKDFIFIGRLSKMGGDEKGLWGDFAMIKVVVLCPYEAFSFTESHKDDWDEKKQMSSREAPGKLFKLRHCNGY